MCILGSLCALKYVEDLQLLRYLTYYLVEMHVEDAAGDGRATFRTR